eukprot:EG_transcript_11334
MRIPAFSHPSLGPMPSDGTLCGSLPLTGATGAKQPPPAREDKAENRRVCLDYLKGRCVRRRCRFPHPDLSDYRQLSGAVQAQAGRQVCEVWAMTGQCKFGGKCSKLHPYIITKPAQSAPNPAAPPERPPCPAPAPAPDAPGTPLWGPTPADLATFSSPRRPAHTFPFSRRTTSNVTDLWESPGATSAGQRDTPGTPPSGPPQPESDPPTPVALAALEADLSKARHALRGCALPSTADPVPSVELEDPQPLLDMLRALNVAAC